MFVGENTILMGNRSDDEDEQAWLSGSLCSAVLSMIILSAPFSLEKWSHFLGEFHCRYFVISNSQQILQSEPTWEKARR